MKKSAKLKTQYWLFKSEPNVYSIDHLAQSPKKTTHWEGVRNYQARNLLRDDVQVGDGVLFYHSRVAPMAVAGSCRVTKAGYPDHTAFDPKEKYYDPKSDPDDPRWFMVDVQLVEKFPQPVTRDDMKACNELSEMMVLKRGARLSIQPVTHAEWLAVHKLAGIKPAF